MRVKVRFNAEAGQPPVIVDLRFLPRIGERIELGFRRVIEVMEVRRIDNDNRYAGIVRAKFIYEERRPNPTPPRPMPMPMPMPPVSIPSLGVEPTPAAATDYGNVSFENLAATINGQTAAPDLSNI